MLQEHRSWEEGRSKAPGICGMMSLLCILVRPPSLPCGSFAFYLVCGLWGSGPCSLPAPSLRSHSESHLQVLLTPQVLILSQSLSVLSRRTCPAPGLFRLSVSTLCPHSKAGFLQSIRVPLDPLSVSPIFHLPSHLSAPCTPWLAALTSSSLCLLPASSPPASPNKARSL